MAQTGLIARWRLGVLTGVVGGLALAGAAAAQQGTVPTYEPRGGDLRSGPGGAPAYGSPAASDPAAARLQVRIDQLEAELRRLTNNFERLQFRYDRLQTTVNQLAKMVHGEPMAGQPGAGDPVLGDPSVPDDGAMPGDMAGVQPPAGAVPPSRSAPVTVTMTGDPRVDFNAARALLMDGEFEGAETAFRHYVEAYPDNEFVGESYYWLGESLYVRELYRDAAQAFITAAKEHPESTRAPDSLLKLAYTFNRLDENDAACKTLQQLSRVYPDASEPVQRSSRKARADFGC